MLASSSCSLVSSSPACFSPSRASSSSESMSAHTPMEPTIQHQQRMHHQSTGTQPPIHTQPYFLNRLQQRVHPPAVFLASFQPQDTLTAALEDKSGTMRVNAGLPLNKDGAMMN